MGFKVLDMDMARVPDEQKFIELVLYIAHRSKDDPGFGSTKLNKLLFYSEFSAFAELGHAISWQPYQKLKWGPAARRMKPVQAKIEEEGWGMISPRRVGAHMQQRLVPLREADASVFDPKELRIVDRVVERLRNHGAVSISQLSHEFVGWRAARLGETIPYETVYFSTRPLTDAEKASALEMTPVRGE